MSIDELQKKAAVARAAVKTAQAESEQLEKVLLEFQRKKRWEERKAQYACDVKEAVDNTKLPKWVVMFIQSMAYDRGHSAGQSEVDMLTMSMIYDAEQYYRKR